MKKALLLSSSILALTAACAVPTGETASESLVESTGTTESPLLEHQNVRLFTENANVVPLCWYTPGYAREKAIFQAAVDATWATVSPISFTYREGCPTTGSALYVKIQIGKHTQVPDGAGHRIWDHSTDGQTRGAGMDALTNPQTRPASPFDGNGMTIWVEDGGTSEAHRLEYVAVHEMGHVLGFEHEQDRTEAEARACGPVGTGTPVGLYDPDSVMNYCNARGNNSGLLSEGDRANVRDVYGYREDRRNYIADITGDGRAEPIAVNSDATYALRSSGSSFAQWARWSNAFYGTRETAFADVNGDRKADAVAINNKGVFVMTSDGNQFTNWGAWIDMPFYGARTTRVADVNGDGKADVVAVNNKGIYVMTSTGSGFTGWAQWSDAFFGTLSTEVADVNGDGKADVIANRGNRGIYVRLSNGSRFLPETKWFDAFFGERQTAFADVNGDGKADGLAVNDGGIAVVLSSGTSFTWAGVWGIPFYGSRETLFGDVNGDGKADAIAVNNGGDWVMTSTGTTFAFQGQWSSPFYSQR